MSPRIMSTDQAYGFERIIRIAKKWMEDDGQPHVVSHRRWRNHDLSAAIFKMERMVEEFWASDRSWPSTLRGEARETP